jgi:RNA polymerase sigma-70 factor, ECF subfamily
VESQAALIEQTQRGDTNAFGHLYETYADRVYRYLIFRTQDANAAEDLSAETFIKAFQNIRRYRAGQAPFSAWLFRIAHNVMVDHWRASARRKTVAWEEMETVPSSTASHEISQVFTRAELAWGVAQLTDLQQQVIALRFSGGCSIAETAHALDRSEEAIKDVQHKALAALRKHLDARG